MNIHDRLSRIESWIGFAKEDHAEDVIAPALTLNEVRDLIVKELALVAPPAAPLPAVVSGVGLAKLVGAPPATLSTAAAQPPVTSGQLSAKAEDQSNAG